MKNLNSYTDNELLAVVRQKDSSAQAAFEVIWTRYSSVLAYHCSFFINSQLEADDVLQETWLKFYNMVVEGFRTDSVKLLLFQIARNKIRQRIKDESTPITYDNNFNVENLADDFSFIEKIEYEDVVSQFNIALNYLDSDAKESVLLHWVAGLTYSELSQITGESYDTIRKRCLRAMSKAVKIISPKSLNRS